MIGQTQRHPEWRVIVDLFRAIDYGDVIPHTDIQAVTGLQPETTVYYRHVSQARKVLLRDHGIEVESVAKEGYRRVEPERYGERGRRDVRLGTRRIKRGGKVVESAPVHLLSPDQVKELEHTMLLVSALKLQCGQVIKSMRNVLPPVQPRALLAVAGAHAKGEGSTH